MSIPLPDTDLSSAIVGTVGEIDFGNVALPGKPFSGALATLELDNESGCGLQITWVGGGGGFPLMAGAWKTINVPPNATGIRYRVNYVLPNQSVSLLVGAYYNPNEPPPQQLTLGNSPIGVTQTSQPVQTLNAPLDVALASGVVVVNGSQGSVTCWQWVTGQFIYTEIFFDGYENTTSGAQNLVLPVPYASLSWANVGGVGAPNTLNMQFLKAGNPITLHFPTAFTGGNYTAGNTCKSYIPYVEMTTGWDTLAIPNGYTANASGWIHIVGV
jgi:hypothetical protein